MHYEYKLVPAPRKARKARGVKGAEARFAYTIQTLMNELAADGWEFQRAETLPSDERQGLKSTHTVYRDLLVFRRARPQQEAPVNPVPLPSQDAAQHPYDHIDDLPDHSAPETAGDDMPLMPRADDADTRPSDEDETTETPR